jgi:hypothetical protein
MHFLNKFLLFVALFLLVLQGPYSYTYIFLIALPFVLFSFNLKVELNKYSLFIYLFIFSFLVLGYINNNPVIKIEFKNLFYWSVTLNFGLLIFKHLEKNKIVNILSFSIIFLSFIYVLLKFQLINNIYMREALAEYHNYKTMGPYLLFILLHQFYYILNGLPKDKKYFIVTFFSLVTIFISGSNQYLSIFIIGVFINCFKLSFKATLLTVTLLALFFFILPKFIPTKHLDKISEITSPTESATLLTRFSDLAFVYNNNYSNLFIGEGFGVKSYVERVSFSDTSIISKREFLEIDNGFYYLYHGTGIVGLSLFIILILKLLSNLHWRAKLFFSLIMLVTNLLSIHFFTSNQYALFFSLLIIYKYEEKKYITS